MMLHNSTSLIFMKGFEAQLLRAEAIGALEAAGRTAFERSMSAEDEPPEEEEGDASLDEAAEDERDYVRRRLRDELGREPSEEEVNDWLRQHTEGY